jgi:hypothetical protein
VPYESIQRGLTFLRIVRRADQSQTRQNGHSQQPTPKRAESDDGTSKVAGEWFQSLGSLSGTLDIGVGMDVKSLVRPKDDCEHDNDGSSHSGENIQSPQSLLESPLYAALSIEGCRSVVLSGSSPIPSNRSAFCEKKRYGEIVVLRTASKNAKYTLLRGGSRMSVV